jgi:hypothetical protein
VTRREVVRAGRGGGKSKRSENGARTRMDAIKKES